MTSRRPRTTGVPDASQQAFDDVDDVTGDPTENGDGEGFEAVFTRLEEVSQQLDAGGLTLEQSLALYEEGMALAQRAQALLAAAEQRIETLRQAMDGSGGEPLS